MYYALGRFLYRRRWPVVFCWILVLALSLPAFPFVRGALKVGGFSTDQLESARARQMLRQEIDLGSSSLEVIFTSREWTARDPRFIAETERALAGLEGMPEVKRIVPHTVSQGQVSPDGYTAFASVVLNVQPEVSQRLMPELERRIRPPDNLTMYLSGAPAFYADIERLTEEDLQRAEVISFPFAVIALALVFGSAVAAGLPILVGGVAVAATLAVIFLAGQVLDLSIFVTNVVTMLGLGLGMDYSLLMTNRFREELRTHPVDEALARTVATAGKAVLFSGLTVCVGLAGLFLFDFMMLRSVGLGGAVVVFFSVLAAVTLLPAAMGILGHRVSALRVRPLLGDDRPGIWAGLATWVMRHPALTMIPTLGLLLLLGAPFLHVRLSAPDARILPTSVASRQGFDLLEMAFGESELSPILIAVRTTDPVLAPASLDALYDLTRRIEADPRVARVFSVVNVDPRISREQYQLLYADPAFIPDAYARGTVQAIAGRNVTLISVVTRGSPLSDEAKDLVRDLRRVDPDPRLTFLVDGGTAELMDVVDRLYTDFPKALALIMATTYIILLILFRSVVLPLKAILMNSLSILASYGALVFVFQDGNLAGLLRFTPLGYVEATLPIIMFCILFGLSMDYEIFLLTRIKESYDLTGDNAKSVAAGLERSGRIITSAALIVVLVSFSFVAADIILIKALGLGVALAVLLDATVIRALLVPATMRLLGDWNWWAPAFLRRLLPEAHFAE